RLLDETVYGSSTNPYATPLWEVVWSKGEFDEAIPYGPVSQYRQLNTTYVAGPDGKVWATGIGRDKLNNFFGLAPLQRYNTGTDEGGLRRDGQLNSVDDFTLTNTGMRNLEKVHASWANPTEEDILEAIEDGFKKVTDAITDPSWADNNG